MKPRSKLIVVVALLAIVATVTFAQRRYQRRSADRAGVPDWTNEVGFEKDVFTFVRIHYSSTGRGGWGGWGGDRRWYIDAPDADLNLAYRLQQMTSLKVYPDEKNFELTSPELQDFPFIYIVEPGWLEFTEDEVAALKKYLLNGGFLMVDDFWGRYQWQNFYEQIKRVFPDREPQELPMDHPIFHSVFDLKQTKNEMQIPSIEIGRHAGQTGVTWEYHEGEACREVHFKGIFDDKGRMMVFMCHNTDNGDGWEREGEDEYYFREFSEKKAYPLAINAIFYTMTH
jgi:hypothetical protein